MTKKSHNEQSIVKKRLLCMVVFVIFVISILLSSEKSFSDETKNQTMAAARRLMQSFDIEELRDGMMGMLDAAKPYNVPSFECANMIDDALNAEWLKGYLAVLYARYFTAEELNALADFYETDLGRSVMEKLARFGPELGASLGQIIPFRLSEVADRHPDCQLPN